MSVPLQSEVMSTSPIIIMEEAAEVKDDVSFSGKNPGKRDDITNPMGMTKKHGISEKAFNEVVLPLISMNRSTAVEINKKRPAEETDASMTPAVKYVKTLIRDLADKLHDDVDTMMATNHNVDNREQNKMHYLCPSIEVDPRYKNAAVNKWFEEFQKREEGWEVGVESGRTLVFHAGLGEASVDETGKKSYLCEYCECMISENDLLMNSEFDWDDE